MQDYSRLRDKIRHFLLQQSISYQEAIVQDRAVAPGVLAISKELSKKCGLGTRRLQKYLSESVNEKDLSITLGDIEAFAAMKQISLSSFMAYLLDETGPSGSLKPWEENVLAFFKSLHLSLRRDLNVTIFKEAGCKKSERILGLMILLYSASDEKFSMACRSIENLESIHQLINTLAEQK